MSLFSILCATRNQSAFIENTINSVLSQDYNNWEMIICDDCSEDNTFELCSKFKDPRVKVFKNNKRLYCGSNYAQMLSMANGVYCGVLDGDDLLKSEAVSTVIQCYQKYPQIDFIWTKHKWCNGNMTREKKGISNAPKRLTIYDSEEGFKHIYSHWRTFKTSLREKGLLFKDMRCTVDKELGYTLEELGCGGFLPKELYLYRYHKNNMSHNSKQKEAWARIRKEHRNKKRYKSIILD